MARGIDAEIDLLSQSVVDRDNGKIYKTVLYNIDKPFIDGILKKDGWSFNWKKEWAKPNRLLYKMILAREKSVLLGLISIEIKSDHVFVHLVENAPFNRGARKRFLGVGGNLFAFACKTSIEKGFGGVIAFVSKSSLIEHYSVNLGAVHIKNRKMIVFEQEALELYLKYFGNEKG